MTFRKHAQRILSDLRNQGYIVRCKLNATNEVLYAELQRLESLMTDAIAELETKQLCNEMNTYFDKDFDNDVVTDSTASPTVDSYKPMAKHVAAKALLYTMTAVLYLLTGIEVLCEYYVKAKRLYHYYNDVWTLYQLDPQWVMDHIQGKRIYYVIARSYALALYASVRPVRLVNGQYSIKLLDRALCLC